MSSYNSTIEAIQAIFRSLPEREFAMSQNLLKLLLESEAQVRELEEEQQQMEEKFQRKIGKFEKSLKYW